MNIKKVLEVNDRAYKLLQWLEVALAKGFISVEQATGFITNPLLAEKWIVEHYLNFSPDSRPVSLSAPDLIPFVNIFSSFGTTSFQLKNKPGLRYVPHHTRGLRERYIPNHFIVPLKLGPKDKSSTSKLKLKILSEIIAESEISLGIDLDNGSAENKTLVEAVAIVTYCELLLDRTEGKNYGKTHLALWREFAWTEAGSPKQKFKLTYSKSLKAKELILKEFLEKGNDLS